MTRLPTPGGDNGNWGTILNGFLLQAHKANGSLKDNSVTTNAVADGAISSSKLQNNSVDSTKLAGGGSSDGQVLVKDSAQSSGMKWADAGAGTSADGAPIYLTWTGSDYTPTSLKASTTRGKIFVGPTDPATVGGVVLSAYDTWNQTA